MQSITSLRFRQTIQKILWFVIFVASSISIYPQLRYSTNKAVIKDTIISSKILGEDRKISIYKPEIFPEYADVNPPIIYLFDGEAYVDYFANILNMVCQRFVQMPPITLVGIQNYVNGSFNARNRDFTTASDKFMQFVSEEVIPFIEKDYKKTPYRTIVGHSASAKFAMDVFLKNPSLFNGYIVSSTYLSGGSRRNIQFADSALTVLDKRNNTLFLSWGMESAAQRTLNALDSLLKNKVQKGLSYKITQYPAESHYSVMLKTFYDGFQYVFRTDPAASLKSPNELTAQLLHDHYYKLVDIFGVPIKPPQALTGEYGQNFSNIWNNLDKALEFFKENADNYPAVYSVHIDYADALLKKGDKQNAIAQYEKALAINPADTVLKEKINKLKSEM